MGRGYRAGPRSVWDAFAAEDEADADLQADPESPRCTAAARSHEAGEHGAVSGRRGGRRVGNRGANRDMMLTALLEALGALTGRGCVKTTSKLP